MLSEVLVALEVELSSTEGSLKLISLVQLKSLTALGFCHQECFVNLAGLPKLESTNKQRRIL